METTEKTIEILGVTLAGKVITGTVHKRLDYSYLIQTASGIHESPDSRVSIMPKVGMGATYRIGTDKYPFTIVKVLRDGKEIHIQADKVVAQLGDYDRKQDWILATDDSAPVEVYTFRNNGRYCRKGESATWYGTVAVGTRTKYSDPGF